MGTLQEKGNWIFGGTGNDVLTGGFDRQTGDLLFGGDGDDSFQLLPDALPFIKGTIDGDGFEDAIVSLRDSISGGTLKHFARIAFGTADGIDLNPIGLVAGSASSFASRATHVGSQTFFTANGRLWVTDESGTRNIDLLQSKLTSVKTTCAGIGNMLARFEGALLSGLAACRCAAVKMPAVGNER